MEINHYGVQCYLAGWIENVCSIIDMDLLRTKTVWTEEPQIINLICVCGKVVALLIAIFGSVL